MDQSHIEQRLAAFLKLYQDSMRKLVLVRYGNTSELDALSTRFLIFKSLAELSRLANVDPSLFEELSADEGEQADSILQLVRATVPPDTDRERDMAHIEAFGLRPKP